MKSNLFKVTKRLTTFSLCSSIHKRTLFFSLLIAFSNTHAQVENGSNRSLTINRPAIPFIREADSVTFQIGQKVVYDHYFLVEIRDIEENDDGSHTIKFHCAHRGEATDAMNPDPYLCPTRIALGGSLKAEMDIVDRLSPLDLGEEVVQDLSSQYAQHALYGQMSVEGDKLYSEMKINDVPVVVYSYERFPGKEFLVTDSCRVKVEIVDLSSGTSTLKEESRQCVGDYEYHHRINNNVTNN